MTVLSLSRRMFEVARRDFLPPSHEMRVRARELQEAAYRRFDCMPPDRIPACYFVDAWIRAYAAWHNYTGEE